MLIGRGLASDACPSDVLYRCHVSSVKYDPLIANGHLNVKVLRQKASDASGATERATLALDATQIVSETLPDALDTSDGAISDTCQCSTHNVGTLLLQHCYSASTGRSDTQDEMLLPVLHS